MEKFLWNEGDRTRLHGVRRTSRGVIPSARRTERKSLDVGGGSVTSMRVKLSQLQGGAVSCDSVYQEMEVA